MTTKRTEPFRYSMNPPMEAWIELVEIDGRPLTSKPAQVELIDISKAGCRIRTELNLHAASHCIRAIIRVRLSEEICAFPGEIRWQEALEPFVFHYGLRLQLSEEEKEKMNIELRGLAATRRIIVK